MVNVLELIFYNCHNNLMEYDSSDFAPLGKHMKSQDKLNLSGSLPTIQQKA